MESLKKISLGIIKASHSCKKEISSMLQISDEKEKTEIEIYVFYEFIYFFMHMKLRMAFVHLTEEQIKNMQNFFGPIISSTAVDSFFQHWPGDLKEKIQSEFYEKLNDAEIEYSTCKELFSEEKPLTGNSLFSKLAQNISSLIEDNNNTATLTAVLDVSMQEFINMKLDDLIINHKNELNQSA